VICDVLEVRSSIVEAIEPSPRSPGRRVPLESRSERSWTKLENDIVEVDEK
jgi:hypothetical protein